MDQAPNDARVTNAILGTKLDYLIQKVEQIEGVVCEMDGRVGGAERCLERLDERWTAHHQEHQRERGLLAGASIVQSIIAGLAGIFVRPT